MTVVRDVPLVEQSDVPQLLALWKPDPSELQKEKDGMGIVNKAAMCAMNKGDPIARIMRNGSTEEQVARATAYIAVKNC